MSSFCLRILALSAAVAGATLRAEPAPTNAAAVGVSLATNAAVAAKASAATEPTVVTSKHLHVDYANNIGTFEGDVLVVDPRITVRADKMVVYFTKKGDTNAPAGTPTINTTTTNTTNPPKTAMVTDAPSRSIEKVIADGGVVITMDNRVSNSEHAEYYADEGKVVLTIHPEVRSPDGKISGRQITFWRGTQKMDVESDPGDTNRMRLVIFPDDQRKKNKD